MDEDGMSMENLRAMFAQAQQAQEQKALVEFRAGMCNLHGTTVKADKRRGKVCITKTEDGLLNLEWKLRPSGNTEFKRVIFPRAATFEKVPECTTGRVFLLTITGDSSKYFFWMQEPKDDKDEDYRKKIVDLIANPASSDAEASDPSSNALMQALGGGGANSQQHLEMLQQRLGEQSGSGAAAASTPAPATAATTAAAAAPARSEANTQAALNASLTSFAQSLEARNLSLTSVLNAERLTKLIAEDESIATEVYEFLPESQRNPEGMRQTIRSAQIRQTSDRFTHILNGPQFSSVMQSFGLQSAGSLGVKAFLDALKAQAEKEQGEEKSS